MAYIEMQHCYKRYTSGETEIFANQDVSFEIEKASWSLFWEHQVLENQRFSIS